MTASDDLGSAERPWRDGSGGLLIRVRLTPKASRDAIEGIEATAQGPVLKARVRAVPEDGAANAALERLVADWLDVPRRRVVVASGSKSRIKTLAVDGDPSVLAARAIERAGMF